MSFKIASLKAAENLGIWESILGRVKVQEEGEVDYPEVEEFIPYIRAALMGAMRHTTEVSVELGDILETRGQAYGERVIAVMAERGIAEFVKVKVIRLLGSMEEGNVEFSRHDSWMDIAGYCILEIALRRWREDTSPLQ